MKFRYIICAMMLFISLGAFTQTNPRMIDKNYMYTVLFDSFDGTTLNGAIWNVEAGWQRDNTLNIWVDSISTVSQINGKLNLTMRYSPGYTARMWNDSLITADYISGEVTSDSSFFTEVLNVVQSMQTKEARGLLSGRLGEMVFLVSQEVAVVLR